MASSININQNNNDITLQDNNRSISITDNNSGTTVNVTQPVTNVVTVATPGPQGPVGPIPTSGSFTGSFSGSFIGNLTGTASNATSASYALTASYLEGYISPFPYSGSAVITGSLTVSGSSTLTNIGPAIFSGSLIVTQGITGSLSGSALTATSASYAANALSSSFALTASYLSNYIAPFPFTGSAQITGSLGVTGSLTVSGSARITGSLNVVGQVSSNDTFVSTAVYPNTIGFATSGSFNSPVGYHTNIWRGTYGGNTFSFTANAYTSSVTNYGLAITRPSTPTTAQFTLYVKTDTTSVMDMGGGAPILDIANNGVPYSRFDGTNFSLGTTSSLARLHVRGTGTTSGTTAFLVQNSAGTQTGKIDDQGNTTWGSNTSSGTHTFQGYNVAMITLSDTLNGYSTTLYKNAASGYLIENSSTNKLSYGYSGNYWMSWHGSLKAIAVSSTASEPTPATTAILDLQSTTKGFLPTRTNLTSNISSPAQGLMTYITSSATEGLYYYNSGSLPGWNKILTNSGSQDISGSLNVTSFTASNATISGNVTVLGTASINTLIVNQTQLSTGSNQLGDAADDFQTLYGTVRIPTGSLTVSGALAVSSNQNSYFVGGGNVGIGTTTPAGALSVSSGASNTRIQIISTNSTPNAGFSLMNGGVSSWSLAAYSTNMNFTFYNDILNADALFITRATNNIGIGTTTDAGYKLDVNGTARVVTSILVGPSSTQGVVQTGVFRGTYFNDYNNNYTIFQVQSNGNASFYQGLAIGTSSNAVASAQLEIVSTTKGFLPPRTNLTSNISSPAQGLITYVTASATEGLYYYNSGSAIGWHKTLTNTGSQNISGSLLATDNIGVQGSAIGVRLYGSNSNASPGYFQFLYNSGASTGGYLNYTYNGQMTFADTNVSLGAKLGVRGQGTTSATTTFRVENLSTSASLIILDNNTVGIGKPPTSSLDVAGTTRISGSFNTATSGSILTVQGSGSAQPIFTVQGSQGELFSITDSLSGSLFSVNDISGLPILEVFSDSSTLIGNYQDPMLITTAKVVQTNSGSFTMYSLPTASYDTAFFEYSIRSGSNARAGTIMAIQSGSAVNFTETTTTDFGSTSAVSFTVIVTGSNMALTGSSTSGAWTIKTIVRGL